jgi:murein DD-endopeptidase MepM/ murein hydrolase activator NlpD
MKPPLIVALGLLIAQVFGTSPAASQESRSYSIVQYEAPTSGPVVDHFRPPAHIGAPGNRGLEYGNPLWAGVYASADGVVWFSGMVAGNGVVSIFHADGVKTTYTGMTDVWAREGAAIRQGESIGQAGRNIHFGAVLGDHYLDPQILIDESEGTARSRLVPTNGG